nr:secretin N-terminal domain-containing protein [Pseudoalteromonas sp. Isolate6]
MLDVPRAFGREIRLFEFAHISPSEGIEQIKALLEEDGLSVSKEGDVSFVPLPRINSFVAYAASQDTIERISFWARKIDVPLAGDERQYFIYKPKYAKAEDMRESLDVLLRGRTSGGSEDTASKGAVNKSAENVKFSLDKQQNALIFYTTKDEYRLVESLLKKMDVLPGQVILDITILEITLNDEMSSGIKWLYNQAGASGSDKLTLDPGVGTLFGQAISGDWKAEFNWKDSLDDARVLSRPYFIVRDGESATLSSGDQIPIITQTVENLGNNSSVSNSVQYRSTGINVSITPIINSQGVVTLSVSMSVSDGKPNTLGGVSSPTITNRSISTEVLSGDGQTVALGGLIQEKKSDYTQGVPALGELPILGNLFKAKVDSLQRTELMMLITTKVVKSESEVDEFGEAISELYSAPIVIK